MDIVSTMSSVSTTFELLQQKHPILILTAELIIGSNQTSAYKDIESPDSNVSSLFGRTDRQRTYFPRIPDRKQRKENTNRHRTEYSGRSGHKRDRIRTRTVRSTDLETLERPLVKQFLKTN